MSGLFADPPADDPPPPPDDGPGLFGDAPSGPTGQPMGQPAPQTAAYRVLARKYRPATFDDLIGQETMVRTLRNAFATGRIAHAFMLTGVRGVGKTTTARIIARALNCVGPDGTGGPTADPCGTCANCTAIMADRHTDVMEMDAASRNGIGDIREIIEFTRSRPMQARYKLFILDEVHMLSTPAFNALLKTLEEPPPHVKFIFATTEIRKVPITVLSRCQRFDLRRVRVAELSQLFARIAAQEAVAIAPAALDLIARAADGSVRDGLSLLDQAIAQGETDAEGAIALASVADMLGLADREMRFDLLEAVLEGKPAAALAMTDRAHEHGADLGTMLQDMLELTHTITRLKSIPGLAESAELPEAEHVRGGALAARLSVPVLARIWQMLLKGVAEVESAPDRRAAAEMVLIRLCHVADMPTPGELVRRLTAETGPGAPSGGPAPNGGGGGGVRAVAGGAPMLAVEHVPAPAIPASFRDAIALVATQREAMLHAQLLHSVHLIRYAPPVIELRTQPDAPRDLASRFARVLQDATGIRWTIALTTGAGTTGAGTTGAGEPTVAAQGAAADASRRASAADHPLVRAIMDIFPGARIEAVEDSRMDAYGLPPPVSPSEISLGEPDMPDFAPPDAEFSDDAWMEPD